MDAKKSFMIYFDAIPAISALESAQRGELFSALCDYALRASREPIDPTVCLGDYPALGTSAQMIFLFMAGCVARDTSRWKEAQQRRRKYALSRAETAKSEDANSWMDKYV